MPLVWCIEDLSMPDLDPSYGEDDEEGYPWDPDLSGDTSLGNYEELDDDC